MTLLLTLLLAGMWESAVRLDGALRHVVEEALAPGGCCEHFSLRVTGHSLGAGVASLLTIRWNQVYPSDYYYSAADFTTVTAEFTTELLVGDIGAVA